MTRSAFGFLRLLAILPAFALVACGDDPVVPEPDPTVSGSWMGLTGTATLRLTLSEDAMGNVTGSGNISVPGSAFALTVSSGTHVFPNLSLILAAPGFQDINLVGTMNTAIEIVATLNGSGYANDVILLTKQ